MKYLLTGLAAALLPATASFAADDVTLQLKWVTQAQFAGYYVALDKGFYEKRYRGTLGDDGNYWHYVSRLAKAFAKEFSE